MGTYILGILNIIKNKHSQLILVWCLVGVGVVVFSIHRYYESRWNENLRLLNGTVETGIWLQNVADDFNKEIGRFPTADELGQILYYIRSFREGVSPYQTNKIMSVFDSSGGWYCDEKTGKIEINYDKKYMIGFRSWVDLSDITFRPQARVEVICPNGHKMLNYSYLDNHVSKYNSDIIETIKNWAATNMVTTGLKNATKPK